MKENLIMHFSYRAYEELINSLQENGYIFCSYDDEIGHAVIMRHDVDYSLDKTVRIAEIEHAGGVKSTFFIMLSCDFYNVFSLSGVRIFDKLLSLGHEIGLHFDEMRYKELSGKSKEITEKIILEAEILSKAIGKQVTKVSMHRPSKEIIEADLEIPGIINTYSSKYFKDYKYLSDSRRRWREPVLDIIRSKQYDRLQILAHPFWYNDEEMDLEESIKRFVNGAGCERYDSLNENFSNLGEIVTKNEVERE